MPLYTIEDQLREMKAAVRKANERADEAMRYAEATARLHHEAICRLNAMATGQYRWPAQAS